MKGADIMADKYYVYRPILNLIGLTEGTDKRRDGRPARGYNETLAYGALTGGDVDLVSMTLTQIDALQTKMLKQPNNHWNSSALGRYQIVRTTQRMIRKTLPDRYPASRRYDADCQDEMACFLLGQRGIDKYLAGRLSEDTMLLNLAKEWASLPTPEGKGYYDKQHAAVAPQRVREVLAEVRRRHKEKQPGNVPPAAEAEVKKKTNLWQWFTGVIGSGGLSLGWLAGMRWDAIVAGGAVLIVIIAMLLIFRRHIITAIRDVQDAVD